MIMGKNTLMKAALNEINTKPEPTDEDYEERSKTFVFSPFLEKIVGQLKGNVSLIFSNGDLADIKAVLDKEVRESPAKSGMLAPKDVFVPAGPTGLDPKQTSFFQTLQIQTKIIKGQIEITAEKQVIYADQKVDSTQAALLEKLKIYPFEYKMKCLKVLQDGAIFDAAVLDLNTETILSKFKGAVKNMACLSLGAGIPSTASAPHSLLNAFKNLAAVSAASGYEFKEAAALLAAAASAPAAGAAAGGAAPAKVEEKEKEEEEVVEMGNLFGDDDEY